MKRIIQKVHESFMVTVPKEIMDDMNLKAGDKLDFVRDGVCIIAIPVAPSAKNELQAALHPAESTGEAYEPI